MQTTLRSAARVSGVGIHTGVVANCVVLFGADGVVPDGRHFAVVLQVRRALLHCCRRL